MAAICHNLEVSQNDFAPGEYIQEICFGKQKEICAGQKKGMHGADKLTQYNDMYL